MAEAEEKFEGRSGGCAHPGSWFTSQAYHTLTLPY